MTFASLIVASLLANAQQSKLTLDSNVTFRANACGLARCVSQIAAATGLPLDADAALDNQLVVINVKDVKVSELLENVAKVTDCEWVEKDGRRRLQASAELRTERFNSEVALQAKSIKETLDKYQRLVNDPYTSRNLASYLREQLRKRSDSDNGGWMNYQVPTGPENDSMGADPTGRLFAKALVSLDPTTLAQMKLDDRIVYSTDPTPVQKKLNINLATSMQGIAADKKVFNEAVKLANLSKEESDQLGVGPDYDENNPLDYKKATLAITKTDMFGARAITVVMSLMGSDDEVRTTRQSNLWASTEVLALFAGDSNPTTDTKIPTRPDALWARNFLLSRTDGAQDKEKPTLKDPRVDSLLRSPQKTEPLSLFTSDFLIACANAQGKNLIAEVSDTSIMLGYIRGSEGDGIEKVPERLDQVVFNNLATDKSWILWQLKQATDERASIINRQALADLLANKPAPSGTDLEKRALYAWNRHSGIALDIMEMLYTQALMEDQPSLGFLGFEEYLHPALLFIGSLDASTRSAFFRGAKLSYSNLPATQRKILDRLVYSATGARSINNAGFIWGVDPNSAEPPDNINVYEPTELCPKGVPSGSTVELRSLQTPMLFSPGPTPSDPWQTTDPSSIAWAIAVQKKPSLLQDVEPGIERPKVPQRYRIGSLKSFQFAFWVAPKAYFGYTTNEEPVQDMSREYTLAQLPPEIQKSINSIVDSYLQNEGGGTR